MTYSRHKLLEFSVSHSRVFTNCYIC